MTIRFIRLGTGAAVAAALLLLEPAGAGAHGVKGPGEGHATCRGVTVDPSAPVISRATVLVKAPARRLWQLLTSVDQWDTWIPEITPAHKETPGPLRPGSIFQWSPQNMTVRSTVAAVDRRRCIAWAAPVDGIDGVHLWTFTKVRGGVIVTTEESWSGAPVEADVPGHQASLDAGLDQWVHRLKDTAEARRGNADA